SLKSRFQAFYDLSEDDPTNKKQFCQTLNIANKHMGSHQLSLRECITSCSDNLSVADYYDQCTIYRYGRDSLQNKVQSLQTTQLLQLINIGQFMTRYQWFEEVNMDQLEANLRSLDSETIVGFHSLLMHG